MCGGFGKLSKLAAGHLDLHSRHSSIDLPQLAGWAADHGADAALQDAIRSRLRGADVLIHLEPEDRVRPGQLL